MSSKILFIDRDGTLIVEPDDFQVDALEKAQLVDGVIPALIEMSRHGYRFVIVSNPTVIRTHPGRIPPKFCNSAEIIPPSLLTRLILNSPIVRR